MSSRTAMLFLLCITLLFTLAACAPAIETDESTWADAITLGSTESTSSTTENTSSATESTDTTGSTDSSTTSSSAVSTTQPSDGTTSRSTTTTTSKTTAKTTTKTTGGTTVNADISTGYVNASTLHVRSGPGSNYESIGGLQRGDAVTITGRSGDWYVIRFGDTEAYVSAQYISSTPVE